MKAFTQEDLQGKINSGQSLRSIAADYGLTHQGLAYYRRKWSMPYVRKAHHRNGRWGSYTDQHDYLMVHAPENGRPNEYVGQHILIAEKRLGRKLERGEHVHHLNGEKQDNRPSNLVVLNRSEHRALHRQLEAIGMKMVRSGEIVYRNGEYLRI